MQAFASLLGVIGALIISAFDPETLARLWRLYLPPAVLLMIYTQFFGVERPGSNNRSWLDLGITTVQPSEFLKVAAILSLAWHLSKVEEDLNRPRNLIPVLAHAALPVLLVVMQKDDGVALIMAAIVASMLFMAGLSRKLILAGIASLVALVPVVWFGVLSDFQRNRFLVVWNPELDPLGIAYQQLRGLTAMGSGQIFGNGIFSENHVYVPENYNDFIFTFLGESLGFVGCFLEILAFAPICGSDHSHLRSQPQQRGEIYLCRGFCHDRHPDGGQYQHVPDDHAGHWRYAAVPLRRRQLGTGHLRRRGIGAECLRRQQSEYVCQLTHLYLFTPYKEPGPCFSSGRVLFDAKLSKNPFLYGCAPER